MSDLQDLENEIKNDSPADSDFSAPVSEESRLAEDFDNLAVEITKLKETLARSQADYKNLVTRTERERIEMGDYVTEKLVTKLLPSVDNLDRLLSGTPENERGTSLYQGVQSTFSGMVRTLESIGVMPFESIGKPLNPDFHEAVAQVLGEE